MTQSADQKGTGLPKSKRIFDLLAASFLLIFLWPVLLLIGVIIRFNLGTPTIFCQVRPGYRSIPFNLYKFRTMTDERDPNGKLLPDKQRITKFGKFLRSFSLDELPELLNVLKGEMSLVGPRPLLMKYLERYDDEQVRRHEVRPGITGWAQINGRNILTWQEKFNYDVWYVDNWSFWLDLKIMFLTISKVIKREGISQPGSATAEEFMGNSNEKDH
jgi:sugar transferase EpsL